MEGAMERGKPRGREGDREEGRKGKELSKRGKKHTHELLCELTLDNFTLVSHEIRTVFAWTYVTLTGSLPVHLHIH